MELLYKVRWIPETAAF